MQDMATTADRIAKHIIRSHGAESNWLRDKIDLLTFGELDTTEMDLMEEMVWKRLRKYCRATN